MMMSLSNWEDNLYLNISAPLKTRRHNALTGFTPLFYHGKYNLLDVGRTTNTLKSLNMVWHSYDAVYVAKPKKRQQQPDDHHHNAATIIYSTPHLIFTHETGKTTVEIQAGIPHLDSVIRCPGFQYRIVNGKAVAVFTQPGLMLLSLSCHNDYDHHHPCQAVRRILFLRSLVDMVCRLKHFFLDTLYLPYLVHPFHTVVDSSITMRLHSGHLLYYVFSPHSERLKIKDVLYLHPLAFATARSPPSQPVVGSSLLMTQALFLDFLHLLFITGVWIANGGHDGGQLSRNQTILKGVVAHAQCKGLWQHPVVPNHLYQCQTATGLCQSQSLQQGDQPTPSTAGAQLPL